MGGGGGGAGGGGRKLGALVQTSIKRLPPSFSPNYDAKGGAYNRASTVYYCCLLFHYNGE